MSGTPEKKMSGDALLVNPIIGTETRSKEEIAKEKCRISQRKYRAAHREEINLKKKIRYIEHREELLADCKKYREENRDEILEASRRRHIANPEKRKAAHRKRETEHPEEIKEYSKKWRAENPEKVKKAARKTKAKNADKIKAYNKKYRQEHPEVAREWQCAHPENVKIRNKKRKTNHPEEVKAEQKKWNDAHPENRKANKHKHRARLKNAEGSFTADDIKLLLKRQHGNCVVCGKNIKKKYHIDHVMPLARGGSNKPSNLQLLCPDCNFRKNAKHPIDFMQEEGFLL